MPARRKGASRSSCTRARTTAGWSSTRLRSGGSSASSGRSSTRRTKQCHRSNCGPSATPWGSGDS
eukprot:4465831-Prymnesium_polylepis.1